MRRVLSILLCAVLVLSLAACGGGKKSIDGYYTFTWYYGPDALEIHGDTATLHHYQYTMDATVSKTDEGADLYLGESTHAFLSNLKDYSPMHVKLSDDGKQMFLSSDNPDWSATVCDVISKEEFDELIESWTDETNNTESSSSDTEPTEAPEESDPDAISKEDFKNAFRAPIHDLMYMHADGEDEDIDDDLFNEMGTTLLGEGNEGAALSQLLKKYCPTMIEAFDALDDEAKEEFFNSDLYSAESILSVNLDDVCNEFKSLQEDPTAQPEQEQPTEQPSFNIPDVIDNVLYDENGVKITYTGANFKDYNESGRYMNFTVHVSNQNPDNKKVTVVLDNAALNGLTVVENDIDFSDLYVADGNYDILAGEERDLTFEDTALGMDGGPVETYMQQLSLLGESTDTLPVETLSFAYTIRVGKDAEEEARIAELRTSEYRDGDLDGLFGTCVAEGTDGSENIGIYVKTGEFGVTAVAVNNRLENLEPDTKYSGSTYSNNGQVLFNGNDITDYLFTEVETTYNGMNSYLTNAVHPGQATILLSMDFNEEVIGNLRRQYEVGNSDPVEITLNYLEDRLGQPIPAVIYSE